MFRLLSVAMIIDAVYHEGQLSTRDEADSKREHFENNEGKKF